MEREEDSTTISTPYQIQRTSQTMPPSQPDGNNNNNNGYSNSNNNNNEDGDSQTTESESDLHYYQHNHTAGSASIQESCSISTHMFKDCTGTVHQMHNLLLYLLSNPEEFQDAITYYNSKSTTSTLSAFHADFDRATDVGSIFNDGGDGGDDSIPVPFMVFASDAEVVLPQAHTASQLFGYERDNGIELEATNGMVGLCQLFMRWLALMPGGDHMNLIEPPGLTVMRIAGGRYRVTAAHRVVWTWNNHFMTDPTSPSSFLDDVEVGDLVSMTIVDVFETDCDGKLLSYCPTFDNRAIRKTDQTVERIRKSSSKIKKNIDFVANSETAARVNKAATFFGKLSVKAASTVKDKVQKKMEDDRRKKQASPTTQNARSPSDVKNVQAFEEALNKNHEVGSEERQADHYVSDDETTEYS